VASADEFDAGDRVAGAGFSLLEQAERAIINPVKINAAERLIGSSID
jgi:hypothetical protein